MTAMNVARWRREMLASKVDNATKVLLVVLADNMDARGHVSVPRSRLAELTGCGPRRITERLDRAHQTGWLSTVRAGKPGTTAAYVATYSDGADVRTKRQRDGAYIRTKHMADIQHQAEVRTSAPSVRTAHAQHGAHVQPTSTTEPQQSEQHVPTASGEKPKRLDDKDNEPGQCVGCSIVAALDSDGLCLECYAKSVAASRAAVAS